MSIQIFVSCLDPNDSWNRDPREHAAAVRRMNERYLCGLLGIAWDPEEDERRRRARVAKKAAEKHQAAVRKFESRRNQWVDAGLQQYRLRAAVRWFKKFLATPGDLLPGMEILSPRIPGTSKRIAFVVPRTYTSPYVEDTRKRRPDILAYYMARFSQ